MKKILPIVALLTMCLGCAPPNKTSKVNSNSPSPQQIEKVASNQPISPGTCSLIVTDCKIISENGSYKLKGKVHSIIAYGAGFNRAFSKNEELEIRISKSQSESLKNNEKISCNILRKEGRYEPAVLELIKIN